MKRMLGKWIGVMLICVLMSMGMAVMAETADTIALPESAQVIEAEAFCGDTSVAKVIVPEGTTEIHSRAFADSSLTEIELPASLVSIADDIFEGCGEITVTAPAGSEAYSWAVRNGYIEGTAILESEHPYAPNTDQTWEYTHPTEVYGLLVTFSEDTFTEGDYDNIYLTDAEGNEIKFTGGQISGETLFLKGNSFKVRLTSNEEIEEYGFAIIAIEAIASAEELNAHSSFTTETRSDGTLSITGYSGYASDIEIPAQIGGVAVTEIGDNAFEYNRNITSVILPDGIERIGWAAFEGCQRLASINLPESITYIDEYCFYGCESLKSVNLPSGLKRIEVGVFSNCRSLGNVDIPASVKYIGEYAFHNCISMTEANIPAAVTYIGEGAFGAYPDDEGDSVNGKLQKFTVAEGNTAYKTIDGMLVVATTNELVQYPYGRSDASVTVPDGIAGIGYEAFTNSTKLESVTVPGSVKYIAEDAFQWCATLKTVVLNEGVESIGAGAFSGCDSLESMTIPASVTEIGEYALPWQWDENYSEYYTVTVTAPEGSYAEEWCYMNGVPLVGGVEKVVSGDFTFAKLNGRLILESYAGSDANVVIPGQVGDDPVTVIGKAVFEDATMESVVISEGITYIGEYAFNYCEQLTSVDLPDSLVEIDYRAFGDCLCLEQIVLPENLEVIGSGAFSDCDSLTEITIPASVRQIGNDDYGAFDSCDSLKTVVFEGGNTPTGQRTFYGCTNLSSVTFVEGLETIEWFAFECCASLLQINLPESLTTIEGGAFSSSGLRSVVLPEGLERIDYCAFEYCASLESIYIPAGVEFYDDGISIFNGCHEDFTIYGEAGSSAEEYAAQYGHPFVEGMIPA